MCPRPGHAIRLLLLALLLPWTLLTAQQRGLAVVPQATTPSEARVALVIGNGDYRKDPLRNPVNDAKAVADALRECGFAVTLWTNATRQQMFEALREFGARAMNARAALVFFAGHGLQVKGVNYLVPVDADVQSEDEVEAQALGAQLVLDKLESSHAEVNLLILDACRNNPFGRGFRGGQQGLATMDAPKGSYIAYATAPGTVAADGAGPHSPFTGEFLRAVRRSGLPVEEVFKQVRREVLRATKDKQMPWDASSLTGSFSFRPDGLARSASPASGIREAKVFLEARKDPAASLALRWIQPGAFTMGSPANEEGRVAEEGPQHRVVFAQGFWMGECEVTQAQWQAVMGSNPSQFQNAGPNAPVEMVSWNDAQAFIQKLNQRSTTFTYRLPSEAEWEYACRSGVTRATYMGPMSILGANNSPALDRIAWYGGNSGVDYAGAVDSSDWLEKQVPHTKAGTHTVGQKLSNHWGLSDMLGNVWEWCEDTWHASYDGAPADGSAWAGGATSHRVVRGGSWSFNAAYLRAAYRSSYRQDTRRNSIGLRVVAVERNP